MLRLQNESISGISVMKMEDGDVAVITFWDLKSYLGRIVQRHGDDLISLGAAKGSSWDSLFKHSMGNTTHTGRVRILKKGETLIV